MSDDVVQWPLFDPSANCVSQVIFWKTMEIKLLTPVPHPPKPAEFIRTTCVSVQSDLKFVIIVWKIRKI